MRFLALVLALVLASACGDDDTSTRRRDTGSSDVSRDVVGDVPRDVRTDPGSDPADADPEDVGTDVATDTIPELTCDADFVVEPVRPDLSAFIVRVSDPAPLANVEIAGGDIRSRLLDIEGRYTWSFEITGHRGGVLDMTFRADPERTVYSRCSVFILGGDPTDAGTDAADTGRVDTGGPCVPSCADKLCGEDDGCGTACSGGHRDAHGGVSDCRVPGNCGCGVEPNDNMQCQSDGRCIIRCSCDCLPPQHRTGEEVAGLTHSESCALVFRESGDPTVWDFATDTPLCPLGYDPSGAARCTECPPCHRNHPPECTYEQWCTCRDPRWIEGYRTECCPMGICF